MSVEPTSEVQVTLRVNGEEVTATVPARRLLSDLVRDELGLTGTHVGCEQGLCGACTVLVDGRPSRSCTMLAVQAAGADLTTVEGLLGDPAMASMRASFTAHHALQCGYCTPGILCTLAGVDPVDWPDDAAVRELLAGNICRCTGYQHIVDAVCAAWHTPPPGPGSDE